ncbi:hypothetical protein [Pelagibacterium sp.]|uniref:hypothetical protein n=1 Tax=Pelagibacterium sp. TaxID=1967288 RepID=UPI003A900E2A
MTYKYSCTFPITGGNKLSRFQSWAAEHAPDISVNLPPQVPIKTEALTVRVKSVEDRRKLIERLAVAQF